MRVERIGRSCGSRPMSFNTMTRRSGRLPVAMAIRP